MFFGVTKYGVNPLIPQLLKLTLTVQVNKWLSHFITPLTHIPVTINTLKNN